MQQDFTSHESEPGRFISLSREHRGMTGRLPDDTGIPSPDHYIDSGLQTDNKSTEGGPKSPAFGGNIRELKIIFLVLAISSSLAMRIHRTSISLSTIYLSNRL